MAHLVHVGLHKTGSTWLQRHVFAHVEGAASTFGDQQLFDLLGRLVNDDDFDPHELSDSLDAIGPRVVVSYESLAGLPFGSGDPDRTADRLASAVPDARILIVTREREDLRRSLYAQYVHEGGIESIDGFSHVLDADYLDDAATVARYTSRFDEVLVLDYEEFRDDPESAIARIADFADLGLRAPATTKRSNVSLSGWRLDFLRGWNRYCRRSPHNPSPLVAIPQADLMRYALQGNFRVVGSRMYRSIRRAVPASRST